MENPGPLQTSEAIAIVRDLAKVYVSNTRRFPGPRADDKGKTTDPFDRPVIDLIDRARKLFS